LSTKPRFFLLPDVRRANPIPNFRLHDRKSDRYKGIRNNFLTKDIVIKSNNSERIASWDIVKTA